MVGGNLTGINQNIDSIAVVIPAYNESKRIRKCLDDIEAYVRSGSKSNIASVIVVSDGSTDGTSDFVNNWASNYAQNKNIYKTISYTPNKGKGYAVREGFKNADASFVIYTDADGACPIKEIEKLLLAINEGYDVACGSRILFHDDVSVSMSTKRRFIGLVFHIILKSLGLAGLRDTQCGFKLFKKEVVKKIVENQKCFNFSFDIEYLLLAKKFGYKIKEVPINWYHIEGSKVNIIRDSIKMLFEVLRIRFFYKYN